MRQVNRIPITARGNSFSYTPRLNRIEPNHWAIKSEAFTFLEDLLGNSVVLRLWPILLQFVFMSLTICSLCSGLENASERQRLFLSRTQDTKVTLVMFCMLQHVYVWCWIFREWSADGDTGNGFCKSLSFQTICWKCLHSVGPQDVWAGRTWDSLNMKLQRKSPTFVPMFRCNVKSAHPFEWNVSEENSRVIIVCLAYHLSYISRPFSAYRLHLTNTESSKELKSLWQHLPFRWSRKGNLIIDWQIWRCERGKKSAEEVGQSFGAFLVAKLPVISGSSWRIHSQVLLNIYCPASFKGTAIAFPIALSSVTVTTDIHSSQLSGRNRRTCLAVAVRDVKVSGGKSQQKFSDLLKRDAQIKIAV